jgi:hypothetical protein
VERSKLIRIQYFLFFFLLPTLAWASIEQDYFIQHTGQKPKPVQYRAETQVQWVKTKGTSTEQFYIQTELWFPSDMKITKTRASQAKATVDTKENKLTLLSKKALQPVLILAGGKKLKLIVKSKTSSAYMDPSCAPFSLLLRPTQSPIPLPIAMKCQEKGSNLRLHISMTSEGEWLKSSVFELEGKGERWKLYEFSRSQTQSGEVLGSFDLMYRNKTFKYELVSEQSSVDNPQVDQETYGFHLLLGTAGLSVERPQDLAQENSYLLGLRFVSKKWLWGLRGGADINVAQSFGGSDGQQSLTYKEFRGSLRYRLFEQSTFSIEPMLAVIFADISNPNTNTNLTHQHLGLGINLIYKASQSLELQVAYIMSGFLANVSTDHSSIQVAADYLFSQYSVGLGFEMNQFSIESLSQQNIQFQQNLIFVRFGF